MLGTISLTVFAIIAIIFALRKGDLLFADKFVTPWEKAERKAEKRRQKELAKLRKREERRYVYGK